MKSLIAAQSVMLKQDVKKCEEELSSLEKRIQKRKEDAIILSWIAKGNDIDWMF